MDLDRGGGDEEPDYRGILDEAPLDHVAEDLAHDDGKTLRTAAEAEAARSRTLLELQDGINSATAQQMIDEQVYQAAVLFNFLGVRLYASSGARHPCCFDEETRKL